MKFSAQFFTTNRTKIAEDTKDGIIVLTANGQTQRSGDTTFPFRQDSNFWYLTGVDKPDVLVVIVPGKEEFLVMPKRSRVQEIFDGVYDTEDMQRSSSIKKSYQYEEGWERLKKVAKEVEYVYTIVPGKPEGFYINPAKTRLVSELRLRFGNEKVRNIKNLTRMRMIKQPEELDAIKTAIEVSIDALQAVMKPGWYKQSMSEADLHTEINYQFMKHKMVPAYAPIVAAGSNACTLHYINNSSPIGQKDVLLIDAAAEYSLYAADITRVYKSVPFTKKEQKVYNAVLDTNKLAQSMAKPGVLLKEIEQTVEKQLGEHLKSLGLIKSFKSSQVRKYYPHAVSHHLGLDVHDAADYSQPLAEGMVITIEPGLYVPEWKLGIRLEDDIVITKEGSKNLTARLPYN